MEWVESLSRLATGCKWGLNLPPLALLVLGLLLVWFWVSRAPSNIPPTIGFAFPVMGHFLSVRKNRIPKFRKWRQTKGDIFSMYLGRKLYVVLNSLDLVNESFVKKADAFSHRPAPTVNLMMKANVKKGIFENNGPDWKEQRTTSMSILRAFGMGKNWLAEKISDEVQIYVETMSEFKGEARDVKLLTSSAVSNVICAILLGNRFQLDDPKFLKLLRLVSENIYLLGGANPLVVFPWLRYLPGNLFFNLDKVKSNSEELESFHKSEIVEGAKVYTQQGHAKDNFITAYLNEADEKQKAGTDTFLCEESLVRVVSNLFGAGTETTATTLLWAMVFAINNPDIQEKCHQEIMEVVGPHRRPTMMDKTKLPFTHAFILETQRLGNIAPAVLHECTATSEVGGFTIPKGTNVLANIHEIHTDPAVWDNPDDFRPERFLNEENKVVVPDHFMPFSVGRRYCMGESLAKMELFLFLTAIFQRFKVKAEDSQNPPSCAERVNGLTSSPMSFKVRMEDRQKE